MDNFSFLKKILQCPSVAGFEDAALTCYEDFLHEHKIESFRDALNNCYAVLNPKSDFRIMLEAHIDEIGFQVTFIDDSGFIYVRQCGGIDRLCIPGSQVYVYTMNNEAILGVIGKTPIHVQKGEERCKAPELDELWIDTGLPVETLREKVTVGDWVSFVPNCKDIGDFGITSKGLDDKVGVYVVAETMKRLSQEQLQIGVYGVATVQEEVGCKGAKTCVANIEPNISISLDVGFSTDVPGMSKKKCCDITLGKGPVVCRHTDCCRELVKLARNVAFEHQISIQMSANVTSTGGTNTASLQVSSKGVKTLLFSIPNRYMHTQVEMCDKRDLEATIELLVAMVLKVNENIKMNACINSL